METDTPQPSTAAYEERIAQQVRSLRIGLGLDQLSLAEKANVSIGAIQNLEGAKGSSLRTFIKVLRALDHSRWLETLAPLDEEKPSPMQQLLAARKASRKPARPRVRRTF